ncbi:conjugative relaxosome accessory transposon protein [Caedimonas varicaedens]|uniref:Conjugative relaxosome accessory transposon protein n=1 Tax=Caedimonas varicaedens TaxID=1629334 RepID=A0A0K8MGK3_9PROT|nr:conjugative relaxosome accessory transposon protein [Caedimonas varicaedens]
MNRKRTAVVSFLSKSNMISPSKSLGQEDGTVSFRTADKLFARDSVCSLIQKSLKTLSKAFILMTGWICFLSAPLHATALQKMFESLGGEVNVTTPGGFQDQAAGYYTGGGVVMRQKNKVVSPFNVSLPHLGMGCGGIDLYFGSISAIKGEEMVQLLRSMASGIPTYAFQLAMKTMAPQLENLMAQIRKTVQDMNNMMLDSCQMSQNIVGGLLPTGTAASEIICQDSMRGSGEDWFGARKHCQKDGAADKKTADVRKKSPDLLQGEYNLTWHVLRKMPQYKDDQDFCFFIMTTVGTLISRQEKEGRFKIHTIEGKADQQDYLTAYLKGGKTARYACDENERCLNPKLGEIYIKDDNNSPQSMKAKTSKMIQDLWRKYKDNQALIPAEQAFLNDAVNVPVYRYIQIAAAIGTPFIMEDTSEYIAVSVLLSQFDKISADILEALDNLQSVQLESGTLEGFKNNVQSMRSRIQMLLSSADGQALWRLTQMIQAHEQTLAARAD